MAVITFSAGLDVNIPLVEEHPDGLKATAYFEDFLFKLFQDIENINVQAGPAYGVITVTGQPTLNADAPTATIQFIAGTSISLVTVEGTPDTLRIINDDPFPEAPIDGQPYGRRDAAWVDLDTLFIGDAPADGHPYGRQDNAWADLTRGVLDGIRKQQSYFLGE